ncbi:hypothetical protein B0I35DRAFT_481207 [Stachybotrys elegans]|uniref:Uncharacterized protein n=1 Tax=Stachybotrys elegans TaxID=80388 RepID=A0A8K0WMV0_9HYPO|nr:hypothetical protein B0I35DRAFT_481207 [Stachybotrys elegans]
MNTLQGFQPLIPDANVDHDIVADDIKALKELGAGGLEFLAFTTMATGKEGKWYPYGYRTWRNQGQGHSQRRKFCELPPMLDWNEHTEFMHTQEQFGGSRLIPTQMAWTVIVLDDMSLEDLTKEVKNGKLTWQAPKD